LLFDVELVRLTPLWGRRAGARARALHPPAARGRGAVPRHRRRAHRPRDSDQAWGGPLAWLDGAAALAGPRSLCRPWCCSAL